MNLFARSNIQKFHFKRRTKERAGKDIPNWSIDQIIVEILRGRLVLIPARNNKSYEVYETNKRCFNLDGYLVFDPATEMLVTFLNRAMTPYIEKLRASR